MNYRARFLLLFLYTDQLLKDNVDINKALKKYDEGDTLQLQDLIMQYIKNEHAWMTSIGIIDAMDIIYEDAKANGNLTAEN